ncbi:DUF6151 family protein [Gymnodinialimonas ceratoperidinii]|uniref:Uncharacterized protein n=1 Tax=Gymnodinialimonas ceratoperidinii TaxID=2856823 RepID=A0A8F6Y9R6_9RHOB|nr:DUF6151 family protein [Gymnodinialimonas ceratoperidinii]QXT39219.1 hypothetical protein KYE46_15015 [Gymnodinialimonas ceratoperidinii]
MSVTDLPWSCRCGATHGKLEVGRGSGTAAVCHCESCTRAQRHFGVDASQAEGVAVFQTTPDRFTIMDGAENLGLARLSPKGAYRWYARCCNTQLGVSSTTPKFAFFSAVQTIFPDPAPLGKARTHAFVQQPGGKVKHTRLMPAIIALLTRSVTALTSGNWRDTPFFDVETGQPIAPPEVLPKGAGSA